jgi:hypothetical protein
MCIGWQATTLPESHYAELASVSPLNLHVSHVHCVAAEEQMPRVYTSALVTAVAYFDALSDRPMLDHPSPSMSEILSPLIHDVSIPIGVDAGLPNQAAR